eukprot:8621225-Pyramimonas_sp.AAC.1
MGAGPCTGASWRAPLDGAMRSAPGPPSTARGTRALADQGAEQGTGGCTCARGPAEPPALTARACFGRRRRG